jgi:hypothetical protein
MRRLMTMAAAVGIWGGAAFGAGLKSVTITATNPRDAAVAYAPSVVSVEEIRKIAPDFDPAHFVLQGSDASLNTFPLAKPSGATAVVTIAAQADDLDGDGQADEIAFVLPYAAHEAHKLKLSWGSPDDLKDIKVDFPSFAHARMGKYDGMGWENERIAWRLYNDKRNAVDLFGKRKHELALDFWTKPETKYQNETPLGRDILYNGDAIGPGAIAAWVDDKLVKVAQVDKREPKIRSDGPVRSVIDFTFTGWKVADKNVDLKTRATIWAGEHGFWHELDAKNAQGLQFITSLPVKENVERALKQTPSGVYLTTWGHQVVVEGPKMVPSLPDQLLGMAVLMPGAKEDAVKGLQTKSDDILKIPTTDQNGLTHARFYVAAGWDQEAPDGDKGIDPALQMPEAVKSFEAWQKYLDHMLAQISQPPTVKVAPVGVN